METAPPTQSTTGSDLISGFPDLVAQGFTCVITDPKTPGRALHVLAIGLAIKPMELEALLPFVDGMRYAVNGVALAVHRFCVEKSDDVNILRLDSVLPWKPDAFPAFSGTEPRLMNVELIDSRLKGKKVLSDSRPTALELHGSGGGATGNPRDSMTPVMPACLQPCVNVRNTHKFILTFEPDAMANRTPLQFETVFVNGVAGTIIDVHNQCAVVVVFTAAMSSHTTLAAYAKEDKEQLHPFVPVNAEFEDELVAQRKHELYTNRERRDAYFMEKAMYLGEQGRTRSGALAWIGAVLVDDETQIAIGMGHNTGIKKPEAVRMCLEEAYHEWIERFDQEAEQAKHSMTLYLTHEPSSIFEGNEEEEDEGEGGRDAFDKLRMGLVTPAALIARHTCIKRIVLGSMHAATLEDTELFKCKNTDTQFCIIDQSSELAKEIKWSLREFIYYESTGLPYTTFVTVQTLDGHPVDRSLVADFQDREALSEIISRLRIMTNAIVTDGFNLVRNPAVFEGIVADEDAGLRRVLTSGISAVSSKDAPEKEHKFSLQALPVRVVTTDTSLPNLLPRHRKAIMPSNDRLGSVFVYGTTEFLQRDIVVNSEGLKDAGILNESTPTGPDVAQWMSRTMAHLWPNNPNFTVTGLSNTHDENAPEPGGVFRTLGTLGIMTALVEGDIRYLLALCETGLVQEWIICTVPTIRYGAFQQEERLAPPPTGKLPWKCLLPIATGQLGESSIVTQHLRVVYE